MNLPVRYAGFWRRFAAACIDLLLSTPFYIALRWLLPSPSWLADTVFIFLWLGFYVLLFASPKQGSPGMWMMGFRIVSAKDHARISYGRALWWAASSLAGWLAVGAGVLYLQLRYNLDSISACAYARFSPALERQCGGRSLDDLFGTGGLQAFLFWAMIALGAFFGISFIWALSIGLSGEKTGFHNVLCGTRFIRNERSKGHDHPFHAEGS
jgi:uncharacterized RDD family membrane protein YckC